MLISSNQCISVYFQHHYCSLQCHMIFRNHNNILIYCSRNISDYYQIIIHYYQTFGVRKIKKAASTHLIDQKWQERLIFIKYIRNTAATTFKTNVFLDVDLFINIYISVQRFSLWFVGVDHFFPVIASINNSPS